MESECLTVVMEEKRQNRIGIITMYYNSSNYGGLLQAYALCKYLNDSGYPTKQITYDFYRKTISSSKDYKNLVSFLFKRLQKRTNNLIIKTINIIHGVSELRKDRRNICAEFRASIPHTETVYNDNSIEDCNNLFDIFIAGSDQIWNGSRRYDLVSFLGFVSDKKKIALAPSFGSEIEDYNKRSFSKEIRKFQLLSAREQEGVDNIAELTGRDAIRLSDPTSFLTPDEWRDFSKAADDLEGEYIFIHFLDKPCDFALQAMEKLRSDRGLPMVAFAYPQEEYERIKGIRFCNGGPREYVKYIDRASYVMTDSFHTTLFSIYFNTSFFTFHRQYTHNAKQTSRISNLLTLYGCEERFVADMAAFIEILDSDLPDSFEIRDKERQKLIGYLKKALDD